MPFMKGVHPVRRTLQYLNSSELTLKPFIQILAIHYNRYFKGDPRIQRHSGAEEFVLWHLDQIQYKNPNVQIATFKNFTPSPFIRVFFNSGKELLMEIENQSKDEIKERVIRTLCKTKAELEEEQKASDVQENPAHFGYGCKRHCMCEIPGQIPCPGVVPLPYHMRGKYRMGFAEIDESKYL